MKNFNLSLNINLKLTFTTYLENRLMNYGLIMSKSYIDLVLNAERLYRVFLDVMRIELKRLKIDDLNNTQALILYNIGKDKITVGDIISRKYYLGSNVSYNLKKMIEMDYVKQERSAFDKRTIFVTLTKKGMTLFDAIEKALANHTKTLTKEHISESKLDSMESDIRVMEKCLTRIIDESL